MNRLSPRDQYTMDRIERRIPIELCDGGTLLAMFIDHDVAVSVILAKRPNGACIALIFDLATVSFLAKQTLEKYLGEDWQVDDGGVFREREGCVVERLKVIREGLPPALGCPLPPHMTVHPRISWENDGAHAGQYWLRRIRSFPRASPSPPPVGDE